jgi:hypothetical protein
MSIRDIGIPLVDLTDDDDKWARRRGDGRAR